MIAVAGKIEPKLQSYWRAWRNLWKKLVNALKAESNCKAIDFNST